MPSQVHMHYMMYIHYGGWLVQYFFIGRVGFDAISWKGQEG